MPNVSVRDYIEKNKSKVSVEDFAPPTDIDLPDNPLNLDDVLNYKVEYDAFCRWSATPTELRHPREKTLEQFIGNHRIHGELIKKFRKVKDFNERRLKYFWEIMMDLFPDVAYAQYQRAIKNSAADARVLTELMSNYISPDKNIAPQIQTINILGVDQGKLEALFTPKVIENVEEALPVAEVANIKQFEKQEIVNKTAFDDFLRTEQVARGEKEELPLGRFEKIQKRKIKKKDKEKKLAARRNKKSFSELKKEKMGGNRTARNIPAERRMLLKKDVPEQNVYYSYCAICIDFNLVKDPYIKEIRVNNGLFNQVVGTCAVCGKKVSKFAKKPKYDGPNTDRPVA